jgi:hypothetical protein
MNVCTMIRQVTSGFDKFRIYANQVNTVEFRKRLRTPNKMGNYIAEQSFAVSLSVRSVNAQFLPVTKSVQHERLTLFSQMVGI